MKSLIQQRMELDRQRHGAVAQIVITLLLAAAFLPSVGNYTALPWLPVLWLVCAGVAVVDGWRRVRAARRALSAFEAEHGADAGVQKPV